MNSDPMPPPRHILLVIDHLAGGGAETVGVRLAKALHDHGERVVIASLAPKVGIPVPPEIPVVPVEIPGMRGWKPHKAKALPDGHAAFSALEKKYGIFDLILLSWSQCHTLVDAFPPEKTWLWLHGHFYQPWEVARHKHCPSSLNLLQSIAFWFKQRKIARKRKRIQPVMHHIYHGRNLVAVASDVIPSLCSHFDCTPHQARVIPNPLDRDALRKLADAATPLPSLQPAVIWLGRFSPEKNPAMALDAFAQTKIDGHLWMVGDGPERATLEARVRHLGLTGRVHFTGFLANPYPLLKAARILLLTSWTEGLPTVLVEALALGIPCVSTRCSAGPVDILRGPLAHGLIPPGDTAAAARALEAQWNDPILPTPTDVACYEASAIADNFLNLLRHA